MSFLLFDFIIFSGGNVTVFVGYFDDIFLSVQKEIWRKSQKKIRKKYFPAIHHSPTQKRIQKNPTTFLPKKKISPNTDNGFPCSSETLKT